MLITHYQPFPRSSVTSFLELTTFSTDASVHLYTYLNISDLFKRDSDHVHMCTTYLTDMLAFTTRPCQGTLHAYTLVLIHLSLYLLL